MGLNPDTAAYTKSKPRVRAYMLEHRAAMQQQLLDQESERMRRLELRREQVLARLWEIAKLAPEMTRGSITGQIKALSMIVAMESLIPDRRAGSSEKKSVPPLPHAEIYPAACPPRPAAGLGRQQEKDIDPQPDPALAQEEDEPACPASPGKPWGVPWGLAEPESTPGSAGEAPPPPGPTPAITFDPSESAFANRLSSSETTPSAPHAPGFFAVPDTRAPFAIKRNPFARRR